MYLITEFFHSLPHLNMWFIKSNATFDLNDSEYLEANFFQILLRNFKINYIEVIL